MEEHFCALLLDKVYLRRYIASKNSLLTDRRVKVAKKPPKRDQQPNNVKKYRIKKGFTPTSLAKEAEIGTGTLRKMESNPPIYTKPELRSRVANTLGIPVEKVFPNDSDLAGI
jgi:DNA-binding XRE family transcriptional regulator